MNEDEEYDDFYRNSLPSNCPNTRYKVVFSRRGDSISISFSCMLFVQEGLLCLHMFFILNMKEYDEISSNFILRRWGKDITADGLLRKVPDVIDIHNPKGVRKKGWASGKRIKSTREKVIEKSKNGTRLCSLCHKPNHNARCCILRFKKSELESEVTEG
ncbi:unnamed protein product [Lactuca saligna]|uniref:Protein FAR1-RELATED SEQUENCE n=1 Tax=Lactuca saligna TaxID=75948 RepID=A0AA36EM69_LACSI|nr:unnamed protein product [Lactuca saligna]